MKRTRAQTKKGKRRLTLASFPFIGAGCTRQGKLSPVSERHDEAFAEAFKRESPQGFRQYSAIE